jgi:hypothetical protein
MTPLIMNKQDLINILKEMTDLIENDNSWSGSIEYELDTDNDQCTNQYKVQACFHTGTDQGRVVLIGKK